MAIASLKSNFCNILHYSGYGKPMLPFSLTAISGLIFVAWFFLGNSIPGGGIAVLNSLIMICGVGFCSLLFGVLPAWILTFYNIPYRNILSCLLIAPLAIPSYIFAMVYGRIFDAGGIFQELTGFHVEIRSLTGLIFILSCSFFPYVFIAARVAFINQSASLIESAKMLGSSNINIFHRVALPVARPLIFAGLTLVIMEVIGEFGATSLFGVTSLATSVYKSWFDFHNSVLTMKISAMIFIFVLAIIYLEIGLRKMMHFDNKAGRYNLPTKFCMSKMWKTLFIIGFAVIVFLAFIIPVSSLLYWAISYSSFSMVETAPIINSFSIAFLAASFTIVAGLIFTAICRQKRPPIICSILRIITLGYAIPGVLIALIVLSIFNFLDSLIGVSLFNNSIFALIIGCSIRFLTVAFAKLNSSMQNIDRLIDDTAKTLGKKDHELLLKVHLPMLKPALLSAFLVVFIDSLKELPITFILRPFNFETLAIKSFELGFDERIYEASIPALIMISVAVLPILYMSYQVASSRAGEKS